MVKFIMEVSANVVFDVPLDLTFAEFFLGRAKQFGDREALIDGKTGRCYTYSELRGNINRCAAALYDLGVRFGDRVCILLTNCVEYPIVFLSIIHLGAICVPINPMSTKYELKDFTDDCKLAFYITTAEQIDSILYATTSLSNQQIQIVTVGDTALSQTSHANGHSYTVTSFERLLEWVPADDRPLIDLRQVLRQQKLDNRRLTASICYSSGTTGRPKGCMATHHGYIGNGCATSAAIYPFNCSPPINVAMTLSQPLEQVTIAALPMFHSYGVLIYLAHALTLGFKMIVMSKFNVDEYVRLVEHHSATVLHVIPIMLTKCVQNVDELTLRIAFASVRQVASSAVPLSETMANRITQTLPWVTIFQVYGMTEILVATVASVGGRSSVVSCGRAIGNTSIKVVNPDTRQIVLQGEHGEICVKSPMIMSGYWRNPTATSQSFENAWFKTGDVGYYDRDGNIYIVDRLKDLLKYKGYQVSPAELEAVLLCHPDVIDAAIVSVKDEEVGDLPRAVVVVKRPDVVTQDIVAFVNERVAAYKRLRAGIIIVERIPRTASGKLIRRLLADSLRTQAVAGGELPQKEIFDQGNTLGGNVESKLKNTVSKL